MSDKDIALCSICGRRLNNPHDPRSADCGGDCLQCMADAGDPDCIRLLAEAIQKHKDSFRKEGK